MLSLFGLKISVFLTSNRMCDIFSWVWDTCHKWLKMTDTSRWRVGCLENLPQLSTKIGTRAASSPWRACHGALLLTTTSPSFSSFSSSQSSLSLFDFSFHHPACHSLLMHSPPIYFCIPRPFLFYFLPNSLLLLLFQAYSCCETRRTLSERCARVNLCTPVCVCALTVDICAHHHAPCVRVCI